MKTNPSIYLAISDAPAEGKTCKPQDDGKY